MNLVMLVKYYLKVERKYFMVEDKTEEAKTDNHGGKRPGAGRPAGAKTKKNWKSMEFKNLITSKNYPHLLYDLFTTSESPNIRIPILQIFVFIY